MADVHAVADEIQGLIQEWVDANDLDQTLEGLHEIPRAIQSAFGHLAEQLRENANLAERIPESIMEEAGNMGGSADRLREAIGFGVQRS